MTQRRVPVSCLFHDSFFVLVEEASKNESDVKYREKFYIWRCEVSCCCWQQLALAGSNKPIVGSKWAHRRELQTLENS